MVMFKKKRVMRKRVVRRRRFNISRPVRRNSFVNNIQRSFWVNQWVPTTIATVDFWRYYQPSLSDCPSYTEFTSLYDQYKIRAIKVSFYPKWNSFDGANKATPGTTNVPVTYLSYYVDTSSSTAAPSGVYSSATYNNFLQGAGRFHRVIANRPVHIYFKPTVINTVSGVAAQAIRSPWLGVDQSAITHRGLHVFASDTNFGANWNQAFDVQYTFYMQFKNPR